MELPSYLRMMEQMQRIGTGFFSGGAKPEEADQWRSRLERNFQSLRCPEEYWVDLAVHYLDGDAHLWWRGVIAKRVHVEMAWKDFLAEFNAKYFPQEAVDRMESRFLNLAQGDRTVREFDLEFSRLLVHAGRSMEGEQAQVKRFMRGL
ncbi:retrotransposon gag domain-containing protein [Escherichia coli]|nr:retrotransposon gag domain-containing protein [Escherichia coli]